MQELQQPEHVHVLLNHLPMIGLLAGLIVLAIAIFQKSRTTAVASYIVIGLMALSVFPVTEFGEKAEDQVESLLDVPGHHWLHEHIERADKTARIYYVTAALAVGGLFLPRYVPKSALFFLWATLLLGIVAVCGGMWTATAGGKIMHREFRYALPPTDAAEVN